MYPRITLSIEKHVPSIVFQPNKDMSRNLIQEEENLRDIAIQLGKDLEFHSELENLEIEDKLVELIRLATEGNERFIEELPDFDPESNSFNLKEISKKQLEKANSLRQDYSQYESKASEEILNELKRNDNLDILASILEAIYSSLIARVLIHASELGIGVIHLNDQNNYLRLHEKMASELSKIGIELVIE